MHCRLRQRDSDRAKATFWFRLRRVALTSSRAASSGRCTSAQSRWHTDSDCVRRAAAEDTTLADRSVQPSHTHAHPRGSVTGVGWPQATLGADRLATCWPQRRSYERSASAFDAFGARADNRCRARAPLSHRRVNT
ncbi:hypothetical protein MRX96_029689 [Rhipicephalus microplus]